MYTIERYGWTVYVKDLPVAYADIKNKKYMENVRVVIVAVAAIVIVIVMVIQLDLLFIYYIPCPIYYTLYR